MCVYARALMDAARCHFPLLQRYVCVCVCVLCVCVLCVCVCVYVCGRIHIHVYVFSCIYKNRNKYIYIYIYMYTTYISYISYICIYTYMCIVSSQKNWPWTKARQHCHPMNYGVFLRGNCTEVHPRGSRQWKTARLPR